MEKIHPKSAHVHFLFEGLLAGEIKTITPQQAEIIVFAMSRAFPTLKSRQKEVLKVQSQEQKFQGYNQQGKSHKQKISDIPAIAIFGRVTLWFKRVCYVCIGLLLVVLAWSLYSQYF